MITYDLDTYTLTIPSVTCFSNSKFAYVKFVLKSGVSGEEVKLLINNLGLVITKVTDDNGVVIFPLREILKHTTSISCYIQCARIGLNRAFFINSIKGFSDREIIVDRDAPIYNRQTYNVWPKKIAIYPKLNDGRESVKLLCGSSTSGEFSGFLKTNYLENTTYNWTFNNPILVLPDKMGIETVDFSRVYSGIVALTVAPGVIYESGLLKLPGSSKQEPISRHIIFSDTQYGGTLTIECSSMDANDANRNVYVAECPTSYPNLENIRTFKAPAGHFAIEQLTLRGQGGRIYIWVDGGVSFKNIKYETKKLIQQTTGRNIVKADSHFLDFPINLYQDTDWENAIAIGLHSYYYDDIDFTYNFPVLVDFCTNGCFLRWVDKHGFEFTYRWSVESSSEEIENEESYVQLDALLQPIERRTKTIAKRTILHSRRVEQDIFDLCKSIIGCQEVSMFNDETKEWEPCFIDDSKADDSNEILKDLVVTVIKYEYL